MTASHTIRAQRIHPTEINITVRERIRNHIFVAPPAHTPEYCINCHANGLKYQRAPAGYEADSVVFVQARTGL